MWLSQACPRLNHVLPKNPAIFHGIINDLYQRESHDTLHRIEPDVMFNGDHLEHQICCKIGLWHQACVGWVLMLIFLFKLGVPFRGANRDVILPQ